jgi:hypothetical protein
MDPRDGVLLFGTDREPFIMHFNMVNGEVLNSPVPLSLRLYAFSGGMALG